MTRKTLYPYREAKLTSCMRNAIIIGSVIFTIGMMVIMQVPSLV